MTVAILVDGMYLENAGRIFNVEKIDISKLPKTVLEPGEEHFKTFVFDALPYMPESPTERQIELQDGKRKYLDRIQYLNRVSVERGYVRPKPAICPKCGEKFNIPVQKQVDVKLSVRLVQLGWSKTVDKIVLIAGDGDLLPAVEAVNETATIVRLAYVEEGNVRASKALIRVCPEKKKLTRQDLEFCRLVE